MQQLPDVIRQLNEAVVRDLAERRSMAASKAMLGRLKQASAGARLPHFDYYA